MAIKNASDLLVYKQASANQAQITEIFFDGNDAIGVAQGQTQTAITIKNLYNGSGVKLADFDITLSASNSLGENNAQGIKDTLENLGSFPYTEILLSVSDEDATNHQSKLTITSTYLGEVDDVVEIERFGVPWGAIIDYSKLDIAVTQDGETNNTYIPIGYSTSASISVNRETRDVTNKDSGGAAEHLAGLKSFEITTDALQDYTQSEDFQNQLDDLQTGDSVFVRFSERFTGGTDIAYAGNVKVTSVSMEAGVEENATFSVTFQGTETLTRQEV
jgi:predicted secreted protein